MPRLFGVELCEAHCRDVLEEVHPGAGLGGHAAPLDRVQSQLSAPLGGRFDHEQLERAIPVLIDDPPQQELAAALEALLHEGRLASRSGGTSGFGLAGQQSGREQPHGEGMPGMPAHAQRPQGEPCAAPHEPASTPSSPTPVDQRRRRRADQRCSSPSRS